MSAVAAEVFWPENPVALVNLARSYGPLRAVDPSQAPIVRRAAEYDRAVLPRWQRAGDGVHEHAEPAAYSTGVTWVRGAPVRVKGANGWGWRAERVRQESAPHLAWRSRDHWLDVVVPATLDANPDALRGVQGGTKWSVRTETFTRWARTVSLYAHTATGRRCIARPDRLAELMETSTATVRRCQRVAERLGLYVVINPGRMLTERETFIARTQGSRQRGLSNEAALVVPHDLPNGRAWAASPAGENGKVTPTRGRLRIAEIRPVGGSLGPEPRSAGEKDPAPPGPRHLEAKLNTPQTARGRVYDPEALDLARTLTETLPWLQGTAAGRLEPALRRFVRCRLHWTAGDLLDAIDAGNQRLGRAAMTRDVVRNPPALLAKYLRDLDADADHPRIWLDPAEPRAPRMSRRQAQNAQLLAEHRRRGPVAAPETRAAAVSQIRETLTARQATLTE